MVERQNYLKVKQHLKYLEEVMQLNPASLERYRFYLRHLLLWADAKPFPEVPHIRPTLPTHLASLPGKDGKGTLAAATQKKILDTSKRFFRWAKSAYPRELGSLPVSWVDTLRMARQPQRSVENIFVTKEEVLQLLSLPAEDADLSLRRDQAAAAMLFLSGMRVGAFTTLPICALDLGTLTVRQWPELGVHTKNTKKATTFLLDLPELLEPVRRWDAIVRANLPPTALWYAPVTHCWGEQRLSTEPPGKNRNHAMEKRLRLLFSLAGVPYKSPHKFRHGHAVFGLMHANAMADYKAVSMNLMHDSIEITDSTYAPMLSSDVQERISNLTTKSANMPDGDELEAYLGKLGKQDLRRAMVFLAEKLTR